MTNNAIVAALLRATGGIRHPASSSDGEGCSGAGMEAVSAALLRATLNISLLASSGGGEGHSAAGLEVVLESSTCGASPMSTWTSFCFHRALLHNSDGRLPVRFSPGLTWASVCAHREHSVTGTLIFLCPETPQRLDTKKISTNSYFLWR